MEKETVIDKNIESNHNSDPENNSMDKTLEVSENNENKFEFVTETIKKKPIDKKRMSQKMLYTILLAILFGVVASLVFVILAPVIYKKMYPEEVSTISIEEDEIVDVTENIPDDVSENNEDERINLDTIKEDSETDSKENSSTENHENGNSESKKSDDNTSSEEEINTGNDTTEANNGDNSEESLTKEEKELEKEAEIPKTIINQITEVKELNIEDYKTIYRQLNEVAASAARYIVTVTGISESTDWFMNSYENGNQSTGLILADNGKELIIITDLLSLNDANEIEVSFCNGETGTGYVKNCDVRTGLVVVAVNLDELSDGTKNSIAMARLGNSSIKTLTGTPVIAIGAPLGIKDSIAYGFVTSNSYTIDVTDSSIRCITTDIYGGTTGNGILIDLDGRVLGIIIQGGINNDTKNLLHAYAISDIKGMLEKLSNGQDLAYLGINGTDVTPQINEELGVPFGAYVTQVTVDSPAMNAGIQNGDIIVKLGTTDINSFSSFKEAMLKCQPGDLTVVTVKRLGKDEYVELSYEISLEEVE